MTRARQAGRLILLVLLAIPASNDVIVLASSSGQERPVEFADLKATLHAPLPPTPEAYWLVPKAGFRLAPADAASAAKALAQATDLIGTDRAPQALPGIRPAALKGTPLYHYALFVKGTAEMALSRFDQARYSFSTLRSLAPAGYLSEAAPLKEAEAAEAMKDFAAAAALYEWVLSRNPGAPEVITMALGRAAAAAGDEARAMRAYEDVYYEWPASDSGDAAAQALAARRRDPVTAGSARLTRELARADRLYAVRRYPQARDGYELVLPHAAGDQAERIRLRVAECDYYSRRYQRALDGLASITRVDAHQAEARYYALLATKALGHPEQFVRLARLLVDDFPNSAWAHDALDSLASYWIVSNEDDKADEVLRELMARFPDGRVVDKTRWRVGWYAYRHARYRDAALVFDQAAAGSPRSDYRPSFLYWAAKAYDRSGSPEVAAARFLLTVTDYANTYYGRLAAAELKTRRITVPAGESAARRFVPALPPSDPPIRPAIVALIQWLIAAEMYDEALLEVQAAERTAGTSRELRATRAWLLKRRGDLRTGITVMRAAYPQLLAAGGETIPDEIQQVAYPLDYWPLIQKYSAANGLDPYVVAALVGQESAFDPNAKSAANAFGLMQVLPTTGRRYARQLGIKGFTTKQLTTPEINIRLGTAIFADLMQRFGELHVALCGYNAGDTRAAQWAADKAGLPRDEWIDDIPYAETQSYVRRIIGTAETYRRLYRK